MAEDQYAPVRPGSGFPGDPAASATPVARTDAEVRLLAAESRSLSEVDAASSVCRACDRLVEWREEVARTRRAAFIDQRYWGRPVVGLGPSDAAIAVVGLAPAAQGGNRTGRIFTGDRSGDWLFAALHRAGLATQAESVAIGDGLRLRHTRVTAAVRCAPPANKPTTTERDTCRPWLEAELRILAPTMRVIITLGAFGWTALWPALRAVGHGTPRPRPKFGHGAEVALPGGPVVLGCYHVSQHNTFTGRLTEQMLDDVFVRAKILAGVT